MRFFCSLRLLASTFAVWPFLAFALDLHVSPDGNDAWSGRLATPNAAKTDGPLGSFVGARDAVRRLPRPLSEPVRVLFAAGTYRIDQAVFFNTRDSGGKDAAISYIAAPGAEVVISGGARLPAFENIGNGRWAMQLPKAHERFEQLWIGNSRAVRARSLSQGYHFIHSMVEEKPISSGNGRETFEQTLRFFPEDLRPFASVSTEEAKDAVVAFYHKWDNTRRRIESVDHARGLLVIRGAQMKPHNPLDHNTGFIIENLPSLLDAPGEWFLSRSGALTYMPRQGETPSRCEAIFPRSEKFITIEGEADRPVQFLRFDGLRFRHAKGVASIDTFEPNQAAVRSVDGVITLAHAKNVVFEHCELAHFGSYGFSLQNGCHEITVEKCLITDMGAGGIKIGTLTETVGTADVVSHNRIHNNIIRDGGLIYPCAVGIWIGFSSDNEVTHNEISDLYYSAVSVGWRWGYAPSSAKRNRIEWNHLHHLGKGLLSDMGGVYTLGPSEGTSVSHNLIHDVTCFTYGGWGLYTDEGSSGILMEGNITFRTTDGGFHQHYGRDNIIRNNIFAFAKEVQIKRSRNEDHSSFLFERNIVIFDSGDLLGGNWSGTTANFLLKGNLYWNTSGAPVTFGPKKLQLSSWQQNGQDLGSLIADPLFENPAAGDFRLKPNSPARQLGFEPIDVSSMGVVGDSAWRKLADTFERRPEAPRPAKPIPPALDIRQRFEGRIANPKFPFPHSRGGLAERKHNQTPPGDALILSTARKTEGRQSLLFRDAPGLSASYFPMLTFLPNHRKGTSTVSFDLFLEPKAIFIHEWRNQASPYQTGPILQIKEGKMTGVKGLKGDIPLQQWVHFEIVADMGQPGHGRWTLKVTPQGSATKEYRDLPFRSEKMNTLEWLGFISAATEKSEFYLDDLSITTSENAR